MSQLSTKKKKSDDTTMTTSSRNQEKLIIKTKSNIYECCCTLNKSSLIALVILISLSIQHVKSTPPVDYFLYTSQQDNNNEGHLLPSIESIYTLTTNQKSTNDDNNSFDIEYRNYLNELGNKTLAIVRNSSHTHDNDLIDMEVARYAWHLMEKQSLLYVKNRINTFRPIVSELLLDSKVSQECQKSINNWLDNLLELNHWATLMWNSWGQFPPSGLFQGTYTDLGSYSGCMSIKDNDLIEQSQYCTFDYQPIIPTRPRFHSIYKKILTIDNNKNNLVNGDFSDLENELGELQQRSKITSHTFGSESFKKSKIHSYDNNFASKYSKRTIVHSAGGLNTTTGNIIEEANNKLTTKNSNLTIKAEVSRMIF